MRTATAYQIGVETPVAAFDGVTGTAQEIYNREKTNGRIQEVFFAFSGTPDPGKGASLDTFKTVGTITVTVTKSATTEEVEYKGAIG